MPALRTTLGLLLAAYLALAVWRVVRFFDAPPSWFPEFLWHIADPLLALFGRWPLIGLGVAALMFLLALVLLMSRADWDRILTGAGGSAYTLYIVYSIMEVVSWSAGSGLSVGWIITSLSWIGVPSVAPESWPVGVVVVVAIIGGLVATLLPVVVLVGAFLVILPLLHIPTRAFRRSPEEPPPDRSPAKYWRGRRIQ